MRKFIQQHFDAAAQSRDRVIQHKPVARYEQLRRQQAVMELLDPRPGELILDVGCGNARDLVAFTTRACRCIGVDFSIGMLVNGRPKLEGKDVGLIQTDATRLPFADGAFDKVSCSEVIEHIPHWEAAIAEISRTVKPGGRIVITTPNRKGLYWGSRELARGLMWLKRTPWKVHPYDEWKTRREVLDALWTSQIGADKVLGACYLPGIMPQYLPAILQKLLIRIVSSIEDHMRWRMPGLGYMICVSGIRFSASI